MERADKRELREARWQTLREAGAARFPGARGRIPNFTGAEQAARRLACEHFWGRARVLKANPDMPQRTVRHLALQAGKRVYLAVPRLAAERPFLLLDPERLGPKMLWRASSLQGADELGRPVALDEMDPIDLVVCGSVAVAPDGSRLGKGGGYSDLEYGLLREAGHVTARTPIVTTVHPTQVVAAGLLPMEPHDVSLDGYATPDGFTRCERAFRRPRGILWQALDEEKRAAIPVLASRTPP